jgi:hypothetical protein
MQSRPEDAPDIDSPVAVEFSVLGRQQAINQVWRELIKRHQNAPLVVELLEQEIIPVVNPGDKAGFDIVELRQGWQIRLERLDCEQSDNDRGGYQGQAGIDIFHLTVRTIF